MSGMRYGVAVLLAAVSLGPSGRGEAAVFVVDDPGTGADVVPGDGVCATSAATCTLFAALGEAEALAGADSIHVPAGTWQLGAWVGDDLEIVGAGTGTVAATIFDGGRSPAPPYVSSGAVFLVGGAALTLRGVAIENGFSAVWSDASLTIVDSIVRGHIDTGIRCNGPLSSLTLIDSTVSDNAGINTGGGIACGGALRVIGSTFERNRAVNVGGAVYGDGAAEIFHSTFRSNTAGNAGGAVHTHGPLTVLGSTFHLNNATNVGGAIAADGALDVRNSTFLRNSVFNTGGAIHVDGHGELNNVTIARNGAGNNGGGVRIGDGGSLSIANSILFGNAGERCSGGFHSDGYNFLEAACLGRQASTDVVGVDPLLGNLGFHSGPTQTLPLLDGSPAIDAAGPGCENTDQRGVPRPQGSACDAGAYEKIFCDYDGAADPGEQCDDGNHADGDGCSSLCQSELLAGRKLHLRPGAPGKLLAQIVDARLGLGWGNFSADDPVLRGATLRVASSAGEGFDLIYDLPASNWKYIGRAGRNRGYRYVDDEGMIRKIKLQAGKHIKVKGIGNLDVPLGSDPNPVHVFLTIGARTYCGAWGGSVRFEADRYYRGKLAPPPGAAP
jgi:cysteine-rich repeat protein